MIEKVILFKTVLTITAHSLEQVLACRHYVDLKFLLHSFTKCGLSISKF